MAALSAREVLGATALAGLALGFVTEPETWPVFREWANRQQGGEHVQPLGSFSREEAAELLGVQAALTAEMLDKWRRR